MARIPTVTSQIAARSGRTSQGVPTPQASPEAFGAGVGRGLQAIGAGLQDVSQGLYVREERLRNETVANAVAQADFTRRELELRNQVGPDAAGYQERVLDEYDQWVGEQAQGIEDDRARAEFTRRMQAARPGLSSRAAQYELGTAAEYSTDEANRSLTALDNRIRLQSDMYDDLVAMGEEVINTRTNVPANVRAGMIERWRQNSAMGRFEGMLESAQTVADIDRIRAELDADGNPWVERLAPNDLNRLLSTMDTARRAIRTAADAQARSALERLEARAGDPTVLIPEAELRATAALVGQSENPVTVARLARIQRDQALVREYRHSTPAEMRAAGTPLSTDGLAPADRAELSAAGRAYGVSLEYMTRVAGAGEINIEFAGDTSGTGRPDRRITDAITGAVAAAGYSGYSVRVTSGLRPGDRGSQHSTGGAADFAILRPDGSQVAWNDPETRAIALAAASMGVLGFGAGPDYMGGNHFHFDLGTGGASAAARGGITVWSDDDGAGHSSGGPGAAQWYADLVAASQNPSAPRVEIGQDFLDRALATPGVRERLAGDESAPRVVAAYAAAARDQFREVLGRDPSDEELYMAHTMGVGEAVQTALGYRDGDPEAVARYVGAVRDYAQAGPNGGVTASAYARQERMTAMAADADRRLAADPMTYAAQTGTFTLTPLDGPDGFATRGEEARRVADYYNIPLGQMQPFTEDEAAAFSERFANGSSDDVLEVLTAIQQMGGPVARAAMNQLDDVHDVYAYAGGLQLETGQGAVAADIVRGQRRLEENPDIQRQIGATEQDISDAFMNATGGALMDAAPDQRQAIMDAALAHYIETSVARGRAGRFDTDTFAASVQAVLGGRQGAPALDEVNGARTVLPPGVSGAEIETAFNNMTVADWASMSEQGLPPRYVTGALAEPDDIADEATLRAIGGGRYRVALSDGSYLVTGRPGQNGRLEAFIFVPTADRIREVNTVAEERAVQRGVDIREQMQRPDVSQQVADVRAAMEDGTLTLEEQQLLFSRYGAMWAYDDQGNRIAPTQ